MATTYTTPKLRCDHFDDWNPGHGLGTVAENVAWIRQKYGMFRVDVARRRDTIQIQVTGSEASVSAFADLYGEGDQITISRQTVREMRSVLLQLGCDSAMEVSVNNVRALIIDGFGNLENYLRQYSRR